jgi:hypothetical protein
MMRGRVVLGLLFVTVVVELDGKVDVRMLGMEERRI